MSVRLVASIVTRVIRSLLKVQNVNSVQKRRPSNFYQMSWMTEKVSDLLLITLKNTILKADL